MKPKDYRPLTLSKEAHFKSVTKYLDCLEIDGFRFSHINTMGYIVSIDTMLVLCVTSSTADLFWAKVRKDQEANGCWRWTGSMRTNGYGHFCWTDPIQKRQRWVGAHRFSFEFLNGGFFPPGYVLMHSCDLELCVNPAHLKPGTATENRKDRDEKGRNLGGHKLSPARVRHLRKRIKAGDSVADLAKRFGLRFQTVYRAVKGFTWAAQ